jgi:hypothetical protein
LIGVGVSKNSHAEPPGSRPRAERHEQCGAALKAGFQAVHVPEPRHIRLALAQAAQRRARRLDWVDGALFGLAVAITIAWGLLLVWLPLYAARVIWLNSE